MTDMTLATLNTLRANAGKAPLASWKRSKAALAEAIAALTPAEPVKKVRKVKTDKQVAARADRPFVKGIFKSKVPAMKDARGKVWISFPALTGAGKVTAKRETNGTYFYLEVAGVTYSGKHANFADLINAKGVMDLRPNR